MKPTIIETLALELVNTIKKYKPANFADQARAYIQCREALDRAFSTDSPAVYVLLPETRITRAFYSAIPFWLDIAAEAINTPEGPEHLRQLLQDDLQGHVPLCAAPYGELIETAITRVDFGNIANTLLNVARARQ